jgi:hypothetical protein
LKRRFVSVVFTVLAVSVILLSVFAVNALFTPPAAKSREFYVGVEYAYADDATQLRALVDKVKDYTNLFVIGSIEISFNRTALDESCDYITQSGLNFIVLFTGFDRYNWTGGYTIRDWMADAQQKYGDKFLGIYKIDEPGGNQIDQGNSTIIHNATSYTQASESYVGNLTLMNNYYHPYTPQLFTADYALHWFDYKAGYSGVFAEFVGNESRQRIIALNRGAAAAFQRDWGVIINWEYNQPPHYLESGAELYSDLSLAYSAGAKYAVVFSYPNLTGSSYGILEDEHFEALQRFWSTLNSNPESLGSSPAQVAYIVPKDYGFGFRSAGDRIWGLFPSDSLSAKIYNAIEALTGQYGARFDILYDEPEITAQLLENYSRVFYWNQSIT